MIRMLPIILTLIVTSGCTAHYYQVQGDTLSMVLEEPGAHEVIFACSLDGFQPHRARNEDGRWVVTVPNNNSFRYYYLLDGSFYLPPCKLKEDDDFGSQNCIYYPQL